MFTLKFYTLDMSANPSIEVRAVVCGLRYDVTRYDEGNYSIAVYQKTTSDEAGTEYRISNHERDYSNCYIENPSGKTIDHFTTISPDPIITANKSDMELEIKAREASL